MLLPLLDTDTGVSSFTTGFACIEWWRRKKGWQKPGTHPTLPIPLKDSPTNSTPPLFPPGPPSYRSQHTPLNTVKVVILGQDPYHNDRQAHGLCFSVRAPTPAPQSLANIYKALANDYPTFKPPPKRGGLLTPWADRGVLLLNTCLTVRAHLANSHSKKGWEKFTQKVIDVVNKKRTRGVVFLAWGTPALGRMKGVNKERHCVLNSVHPSPLSAHKGFVSVFPSSKFPLRLFFFWMRAG